MKITDFALIFLAVVLPIVIVVYINISFTIKAIEEEMYYQNLIDSALDDAATKMKEVENDDPENDYGYSGSVENRVSINANIAVDTFISSLSKNMNIEGNEGAELMLKNYIPAIAIIDYNGVYISSMETYDTVGNAGSIVSTMDHVVHPKRYFSFTYGIDSGGNIYTNEDDIQARRNTNGFSVHNVEFSMDDHIVHRYTYGNTTIEAKGFYIEDEANNRRLIAGKTDVLLLEKVVEMLLEKRQEVIIQVITEELTNAVNKHNSYARSIGIDYVFSFPATSQDEMFRYVDDIGVLAFVQGISVGNNYLNYKAFSSASIELAARYYPSVPTTDSKYQRNLYHKDNTCPEYLVSIHNELNPTSVTTRQQAASLIATLKIGEVNSKEQGFYPCPICNP